MREKTEGPARPKIHIILGSTRQGRQGELVGSWFRQEAERRAELEFEYLDLKDWQLPFFGTAESPLGPGGRRG